MLCSNVQTVGPGVLEMTGGRGGKSVPKEHFLKEALLLEPSWPGDRVHLALKQMTLAREAGLQAASFHGGVNFSWISWMII